VRLTTRVATDASVRATRQATELGHAYIERRWRERRFGDLAKRALDIEQVRREEEIYTYIIEFVEFYSFYKYYILGI
jgi:hypothetical protein